MNFTFIIIATFCLLQIIIAIATIILSVKSAKKNQLHKSQMAELDKRIEALDNNNKHKPKDLTDEEREELKDIVREAMKMNPYKPNPCKTALQNTAAYIRCLRYHSQKLYTAPTGRIYKEVLRDMWVKETKGYDVFDVPSFEEWLKDRNIEFLESRR